MAADRGSNRRSYTEGSEESLISKGSGKEFHISMKLIAPQPTNKLPCDDPSNARRGFGFAVGEIWKHLPVWYVLYSTLMMAMMAIVYFNPSRRLLTATAVFPLFWFFVYFYARFSSDPGRKSVFKPLLAMGAAVTAILIAFNLLLGPVWQSEVIVPIKQFYPHAQVDRTSQIKDKQGNPLSDTRGLPLEKGKMMTAPDGRLYKVEGKLLINLEYKRRIVTGHEIMNVFWLIMLLGHCWYWRGRKGLIKFFVATLIYGFLLESGGVAGDYFREYDYTLYLPLLAAPLATMAGWPMIFYSSLSLYEMIERRWPKLKETNVVAIGLIIAVIATSWDLHIDPVATGLGLWTWHELLPAWYLGVPLLNFMSWLTAVFVYGVGYTYIHRRADWSDRKKIIAMFGMIPVLLIAAAIINFTLMGIIEGFDGPTWQVRSLSRI